MSYLVQAGNGGYLGWKILERTASVQRAVLEKDAQITASRDYFAERLPQVTAAEDLVSDYKLLSVALRAFGLDNDIGNRQFIRRVLEADPDDSSSLVNRLSDKRYLRLNKALGLGSGTEPASDRMDSGSILDLYVTRSFEKNVGSSHAEIELALNARRELPELAKSDSAENTKWYQIIGSTPLRKIFEGAFGLSSSFGQLDVDRQVEELKLRCEQMTGSSDPSQFIETGAVEDLIKTYLLRSQFSSGSVYSPFSTALAILNGG
ncbi:DUF1217 domain-containing protein [Paracoccus sp. MBLB3053]|uniref:DUF1217 domain-containing protein n=1 Tax=Paracoccus aurantius TaxID=3073814 RepID=A0ABU2HNE9_9RHOB|nr:DUF1217 domain-containing protein [Paracoccus sp. MBLB3053]MDS9466070.1 DUF1217 domain-containing protein [Paracoccus sp. MBLB3053]